MRAKKLDAAANELLNPASPLWTDVEGEVVELEGTPVQLQPSHYIRGKWSDRPTGSVRALTVRPVHNGRQLFFHLEWRDETADCGYADRGFPDAAGVLFPLNGDAPLQTMGAPDAPVNAWYWRADDPTPHSIVATGLGTVAEVDGARLSGQAVWDAGQWRVVIGRSLRSPDGAGVVRFRKDRPAKVAFAVWEGSHGERGGIKSFSRTWRQLELER